MSVEGTWKIRLGKPDEPGLLALSGAQVDLSRLSAAACPLACARIEHERVRERFVLRVPLDPSERLYGLGLSFHGMTLNHRVRHLRADHYGESDNGRTHAPVPFYVSDAGYGVFVDTAENISFYMGGAVRADAADPPPEMDRGRDDDWRCDQDARYVEISFVGKGVDVYLFSGETMRRVVAGFNMLCGGGCLPPKWGLGLWHRVHLRSDEGSVRAELDQFSAHGLHVDVLGLEPGWQSNSYPCSLVWDRARGPDPASFVRELRDQGTRVNLWENMYVARSSPLYQAIRPLSGSHTVWGGLVPDVTLNAAREMLTRHHEENRAGVSGYKIDECDGYDEWLWPDHARFPSGHSATAIRNVYGVRLQRMLSDMFRRTGERTYGLVRATNAGGAGLPFCIYNDCYDFRQFLTGLATAGFSGVLWVPEVRDADTAEEWVRRFQLSALSPMLMLNAWSSGAKPWKFPEAEALVAEAIRFRRALIPCLYDAFHRYRAEGIPPFRPLVMDSGADEARRLGLDAVVDQFMIGESLMAAPMLPGQAERAVILPGGAWYDFYTGQAVEGERITVRCPLDRIPLYVKEGGMIPLMQEDGSLLVRCYGPRGACTVYDDDGETDVDERARSALIDMAFERAGDEVRGRYKIRESGWQPGYTAVRFA